MRNRRSLGLGLVVPVVFALAIPAQEVSDSVRACALLAQGQLRLIGPVESCRTNEQLIVWSVTGPQGPQGPAGPPAATTNTTVITFGEADSVALMTNAGTSNGVPYTYSDSLPEFHLSGATFTPVVPAVAGGLPHVIVRSGWDFRPAPAYDFIVDHLMQVSSRALHIQLDHPSRFFAFGAALNASSSPADMTVELFDANSHSLGVFAVHLRRTVLSRFGGTNSNTEGTFLVSGIGDIASVVITNKGDGINAGSQWNWALDNVTFDVPPQP